jgi:RHH-type transcriptional regulator, rel operon repressor / antitoxin RelB
MTSIRLPAEVENRLSKLAEKTGRSKSYYIREALNKYLDDIEDVYLASQALEEFKRSGHKTISLNELTD